MKILVCADCEEPMEVVLPDGISAKIVDRKLVITKDPEPVSPIPWWAEWKHQADPESKSK